jgi:hypothetical protein
MVRVTRERSGVAEKHWGWSTSIRVSRLEFIAKILSLVGVGHTATLRMRPGFPAAMLKYVSACVGGGANFKRPHRGCVADFSGKHGKNSLLLGFLPVLPRGYDERNLP